MSDTSTAAGSGIGFGSLLALLFIALKLTGVIAWSWWWVLAPVWIPMALVSLLLVVGFLVILIKSA
jgi:hypothetical protein